MPLPSPSRILLSASLGLAMALGVALLPASALGQAAILVLGWSVASTLLVAALGAWVAFRRCVAERAVSHQTRRCAPGQG